MFASLFLAMQLFGGTCEDRWERETDGWYECVCVQECGYPEGCL